MSRSKFLFVILLGASSILSERIVAQDEVLIDRVLSIVDGRPIFFSDIRKKIDVGPLVIVSEFPSTKDSDNQSKALNDAINLELILSAARDLDVEVTDADLDQEIGRYLDEQKLTKDKLVELLKNEGETYESYRRDFRNQLTLRRFQRRVIVPAIKVTDKDVETYYLTQAGSGSADLIEVTLRQIQIKIDPNLSKELQEARKQMANDVYSKLKSGLDFVEAAGLYSDDPSGRKNASEMKVKVRDLAPSIRSAVENLKPGEFTAPIPGVNSFMFFQVADLKLTTSNEYQAKKPQLEQELKLVELRNQTNRWLADQRQKVTIKSID
jgi:peptidyl-prolyl cis-trans isomerase SurA